MLIGGDDQFIDGRAQRATAAFAQNTQSICARHVVDAHAALASCSLLLAFPAAFVSTRIHDCSQA
jgi:hypothetical protein